jgi:hypothetical protein
MTWAIEYYSEKVQRHIMALPKGIQGRYIHMAKRMKEVVIRYADA